MRIFKKSKWAHSCNSACEAEAKEYAIQIEESNIRNTRFEHSSPESERIAIELTEVTRYSLERDLFDSPFSLNEFEEYLKRESSKSLGLIAHEAIERDRSEIASLLPENSPSWLSTIPVCFRCTGDPNANVICGPNNHPIIIIDYAITISINRLAKIFINSLDFFSYYNNEAQMTANLLQDSEFRKLLRLINLGRLEFLNGKVQDPPVTVKLTKSQDVLEAIFLDRSMMLFILAHEMSHIALGHLDNKSLFVLPKLGKNIKFYRKSRAQEYDADGQALLFHKSIFAKKPDQFLGVPLMVMKYFEFIDPLTTGVPNKYRTHPFPVERYKALSKKLSTMNQRAKDYLFFFDFLIKICRVVEVLVKDR